MGRLEKTGSGLPFTLAGVALRQPEYLTLQDVCPENHPLAHAPGYSLTTSQQRVPFALYWLPWTLGELVCHRLESAWGSRHAGKLFKFCKTRMQLKRNHIREHTRQQFGVRKMRSKITLQKEPWACLRNQARGSNWTHRWKLNHLFSHPLKCLVIWHSLTPTWRVQGRARCPWTLGIGINGLSHL